MGRFLRHVLLLAIAAFFALSVLGASAAPPPGPYFNGFETNTAGWFNFFGSTVTRVPSGDSETYGGAVPAASGNYFARLGIGNNATCAAVGTLDWFVGPYTDWGGYSSIFPTGGYKTKVDIYLDVGWAATHSDRRFDWASAVNNTTGSHQRDFVFNVGTEPTGFVISGSNNSTRCGASPATGPVPAHVAVSGWYTFEHDFAGIPGSPLLVTMTVTNKMTNAVVGTWSPTVPTDIIGGNVGGNRYGWFVQNEIDDLAIDNSERTGLVSTPGCEIKISDGGHITALNTDQGSFGGNAKVSLSGETTGQQTYHDHGPLQPLDFKALTIEAVICSNDRTDAELYGRGTVNGSGSYEYRIKLHDDGEPGTGDMYGITIAGLPSPLPTVYASGDQTLDGGNIQIR
jgi:hypothetical protein